jgi:hypothetical protein
MSRPLGIDYPVKVKGVAGKKVNFQVLCAGRLDSDIMRVY